MLDAVLFVAAGVIVGWHVPQPLWAKPVSAFVVNYAKAAYAKVKALFVKE